MPNPGDPVSTALPAPPIHSLAVTAYGTPAPQGSKTRNRYGSIYDTNAPALHSWRDDVKLAAVRALEEHPGWERDYRAVMGRFWFYLARPRSHYRTGANAHLLRENAPRVCPTRPDLDKLLRSTWDALTAAGVYTDDSRMVSVNAVKLYAGAPHSEGDHQLDRPGVVIELDGVQP
jgi:Holliday junction resolvase RusA-like endonuclease